VRSLGRQEGADLLRPRPRYEGYPAAEIAFPVRVAATLGVQTMIVTNVSGGIEPSYAVGEIVAIRDHINLTGPRRWWAPTTNAWAPGSST
jgi:purine-nucleoside phosphorylase